MAGFDDIIGQESVKTHFRKAIRLNRVSHAYIINGESGMGKRTMANAFTMTLMCEKHGDTPCMECHACRQIMTLNNPDVINVTHEKPNVISVDEIRSQVNADVSIRPYSSNYKIYIINEAEKMNPAAQNALLKTIEEPPSYVVILLLTSNKEMLLSTILSRCVDLELCPLKREQVERYLTEKEGLVSYRARELAELAGGNIGKALKLSASDYFEELKRSIVGTAENIGKMTAADINQTVKEISAYKSNIDEVTDLLLTWYRDILVYKACGENGRIILSDCRNQIRQQAQTISYAAVDKVITELLGIGEKLNVNVNFDMVMELLLLTMRDAADGRI